MRYMVVVEHAETSVGAYVPDLPGCVAVGETELEVLELIQEAIEMHLEALKEQGWLRLAVPESYAAFAQGNFPTPSGKCEFFSVRLQKLGFDPLPAYHPPRESAATAPALAPR